MKRFLLVLWLKWQRQRVLDDIDLYKGVIQVGRDKIAGLERDNRRRAARAEEIGRRIALNARPKTLIEQALRARSA